MDTFELNNGLMKTDKQKQAFAGPECKKVLRKLQPLREYLPVELHCFIDILDSINEVYTISHEKVVNNNHKDITSNFEQCWKLAMVRFGITMPVKAHIIAHHLSDFFELTGATLRKCSDQVVESAHHKLKTFFESRPNYNHQNKQTVASGRATLDAIAHFNSVQI